MKDSKPGPYDQEECSLSDINVVLIQQIDALLVHWSAQASLE